MWTRDVVRLVLRKDNSDWSVHDWDLIKVSYDLQYRELERATSIAQGLVSAVTLSAALASPLLVIGLKRSILDAIFGGLLLIYLAVLGNAVRHAFWVFATKPVFGGMPSPEVAGFFNHRSIVEFATPTAFREYFTRLTDQEKFNYVIEQTWADAKLANRKFVAITRTIRWTAISFMFLASLVMLRFLIAFSS